jgi:hypothetical protein
MNSRQWRSFPERGIREQADKAGHGPADVDNLATWLAVGRALTLVNQ